MNKPEIPEVIFNTVTYTYLGTQRRTKTYAEQIFEKQV